MSTDEPQAAVTQEQLEAWFRHDQNLEEFLDRSDRAGEAVLSRELDDNMWVFYALLGVGGVFVMAVAGDWLMAALLAIATTGLFVFLLRRRSSLLTMTERRMSRLRSERRDTLARHHPAAHAELERLYQESQMGDDSALAALDPEVQERIRDVFGRE